MAGYDRYSKSNNALDAENDGRYPITQAARVVSRATGVTVREARRALNDTYQGEFHHSSKFYNRVKYYDTHRAIDLLLHGDPDHTSNLESEAHEAEYAVTLAKRATCAHTWTGKSYNWYCPLCGDTGYSYEKPIQHP